MFFLSSLDSKAYRFDASHLGQRYPSILYRKPFASGVYRLLKWDTSAGPFDYPETVKHESGKMLDVVPLKVLLPAGAEITLYRPTEGHSFSRLAMQLCQLWNPYRRSISKAVAPSRQAR